MADSPQTKQGTLSAQNDGVAVALWETMNGVSTGVEMALARWSDKTVTASGTWGSATLVIQGSNDGNTWFTVDDVDGTPVSFTSDSMAVIRDNPLYMRPKTSGGTGSDVDVHIAMKMIR